MKIKKKNWRLRNFKYIYIYIFGIIFSGLQLTAWEMQIVGVSVDIGYDYNVKNNNNYYT